MIVEFIFANFGIKNAVERVRFWRFEEILLSLGIGDIGFHIVEISFGMSELTLNSHISSSLTLSFRKS